MNYILDKKMVKKKLEKKKKKKKKKLKLKKKKKKNTMYYIGYGLNQCKNYILHRLRS